MVIVFDLDDTLYDESTFVRSGMQAVAKYLASVLQEDADKIFCGLDAALQKQRNGVFDRYLEGRGIKSKKLVQKCLSIYRGHEPKISLLPAARACLKRFQHHPIYVVTDGNRLVQKRKFLALGLAPLVRRCFCTYAHGLHRSKPSPYCFEKICRLEHVTPEEVVYVADNPHKDFVGLKSLGFGTIRVLQGAYATIKLGEAYEADVTINTLDELDEAFLRHHKKLWAKNPVGFPVKHLIYEA
ncbi:MAG: HAD family hydrolase [Parachlamydiaceae bacterium]